MNLPLGVKVLIVVICTLISVIVAMVAGFLSHASGSSVGQAILYGGGAFAGSLLLCLAVLSALGVL
ncbi:MULTISPECIES: hypothetical protein [Streptomyces]|uniref:Uncharacterized protein n=1 Tax=Streptomyces coelicolor (strain ATCC BAA-471 / A3(2) / M145) TaxID=100226 RepID=O69897_STRCO|nr:MULTISPECIES: hypothetical protein [Streptomyces]MDX2929613.1 hypothetical protein [Streptomyces sp. NRRL_B-16638]MYU45132.1 hypothetical protein [Streptomyces sp. SID7813]NSL84816.1 hypothetical protein [Streptomyces coelicolor]QFI45473.1 hypothetical protein FQ762_28995 [Streptomyces coelicolor A3(2)]QKN69067.1 hypothetical protein HCU77_28430 [Streptomyces coelicolor]